MAHRTDVRSFLQCADANEDTRRKRCEFPCCGTNLDGLMDFFLDSARPSQCTRAKHDAHLTSSDDSLTISAHTLTPFTPRFAGKIRCRAVRRGMGSSLLEAEPVHRYGNAGGLGGYRKAAQNIFARQIVRALASLCCAGLFHFLASRAALRCGRPRGRVSRTIDWDVVRGGR